MKTTTGLLLAAALTTWSDPTPAPMMREFYRVQREAAGLATPEERRYDDLEDLLKKQAQEEEYRDLQHQWQIQRLEYQLRQLQR